jgi:hypothetical protein
MAMPRSERSGKVRGAGTARRHAQAGVSALAVLLAVPGAAQDIGGGTIETQKLAPLAPSEDAAGSEEDDGVVPRDDRFRAAPFRGATATVVAAPIEPVDTRPTAGARLRQLDKMTGRTKTVEVAAGSEAMIDRLRVRVETCRAPEDNSQHGTMAFLEIWDTKYPDVAPAFSGWMFAESPALSALDHPRYDVWVLSCTTSAGAASAANR